MASGADNRLEAPPRGRLLRIGIAVAALVALDQLTKVWAVAALSDGPVDVFGDTVQFNLSRNPGSAFGRFQGMTTLLAVGAIVVSLLIVREARHAPDRWRLIGYTLRPSGNGQRPSGSAMGAARVAGRKPIKCPKCDRRFAHRLPLSRHLSASHGIKKASPAKKAVQARRTKRKKARAGS